MENMSRKLKFIQGKRCIDHDNSIMDIEEKSMTSLGSNSKSENINNPVKKSETKNKCRTNFKLRNMTNLTNS